MSQTNYSEIHLGIVCPMANEAASAVPFVNQVIEHCAYYKFRAITFFAILDSQSKDQTRDLLTALSAQQPLLRIVWAPENKSVVDAYVRGYRDALAAGCDWILEIDCGFSHLPSDIPQFFGPIAAGYDCVFGSRFSNSGTSTEASKRRLMSRGGTVLSNLLLGTKLSDMTSGFEMFTRPALQFVLDKGIHSRGPFFQTEIRAYCHRLKITEVPIRYQGASHKISGGVIKDAFSNLWRLFRLRLRGTL